MPAWRYEQSKRCIGAAGPGSMASSLFQNFDACAAFWHVSFVMRLVIQYKATCWQQNCTCKIHTRYMISGLKPRPGGMMSGCTSGWPPLPNLPRPVRWKSSGLKPWQQQDRGSGKPVSSPYFSEFPSMLSSRHLEMALPYLHSRRHDGVPVCTRRQAARGKPRVRAISRATREAREHARASFWVKTPRRTSEQWISRADMHAPTAPARQSPRQRSSLCGSSW